MSDRKMMKWQPFDSLTNSKKMKHELALNKQKSSMPTLSQDQIESINENLSYAYSCKILIKVTYFYNYKILYKEAYIKKIDKINKKIIFDDNSNLYYNQIINIDLLT